MLAGIVAPVTDPPIPFTEHDWRYAQRLREAVDSVVSVLRWAVTVMPSDGVSRQFFLCGPLANVTQRAHAIFSAPHVVLIEPAHGTGEVYDRRLSATNGET